MTESEGELLAVVHGKELRILEKDKIFLNRMFPNEAVRKQFLDVVVSKFISWQNMKHSSNGGVVE